MNEFKIKTHMLILILFTFVIVSCEDISGDNSSYNFGQTDTAENPYKEGYDRLPNSIRIGTYNVHRCEPNVPQTANVDRSNYNMLGEVIKRMSPDVLALQELDSITTWHKDFQIEKLATIAGMQYTYGYTIDYRGGKYGNGVLSKEKPKKVENIDLVGDEHRKALICEFEDYVFIATHFCHKEPKNRTKSAEILNEYVESNYNNYKKPIYIGGDLNEANMNSDMFKTLLTKWKIISVNTNTFVGDNPKRIDFVLVYNNTTPDVLGTTTPQYEDIDINMASDHLPVIVDIKK